MLALNFMTKNPTKSLLVVDDSRLSRMMITKLVLHFHPDWVIAEATSGQEAIEKAKIASPDYITMDYNMDGMNGGDAAREILQFAPESTIVIFTANIQPSTKAEAANLGVHFVGKPVTENTVRQALDYFASRP